MKNKFIPVQSVIAKLQRDLGVSEFNNDTLIEWCMEALEAIDAYVDRTIGFYTGTVENGVLKLPDSIDNVIQIIKVSNKVKNPCEKIEEVISESVGDCNFNCLGGCDKIKENNFVEYWNFKTEDLISVFKFSNRQPDLFTPLYLSSHTFFEEAPYNKENEYNIDSETHSIKFSFDKATVLISYYVNPKDSNGIPMIVDNYYYTTAISKYVTMKIMEKYWYNGREGYGDKVQKAERDWYLFRDGARSDLSLLKNVGELERFKRNTVSLLQGDKYKRFFNI